MIPDGLKLLTSILLLIIVSTSQAQSDTPTPNATSETSATYFVVKSDGINYQPMSANSNHCSYAISGNVVDLYGVPYLDFVVNLRYITTKSSPLANQSEIHGYPQTDTGLYRSDPSGWDIWLLDQPGDYELWLTTDIGGEELSPHIRISMPDCSHSFVTVNFVQVKALQGQTPSNVPLVVTSTPLGANERFVLEDNQISYSYVPTLGMPCYYEMAGKVLDRGGKPFINFVVNIKMISTEDLPTDNLPPAYALPSDGSYTEDGSSGWAALLVSWTVNYEVWLTTRIGGEELSAHYIVDTQDCIHNLARFNFVEVGAQQATESITAPAPSN